MAVGGDAWLIAAATGACALPLTMFVTGRVRRYLLSHALLDVPGERSSHSVPTPRGAGLAVVPVAILGLGALLATETVWAGIHGWLVLAGMAVLAMVSWIDDQRGLSPLIRLIAQVGWVVLGLSTLPGDRMIFQGALPPYLDGALAGLLWLWFINLFNFMDGIDGLAGSETVALGIGLAVVALLQPVLLSFGAIGLVLIGVGGGFLVWNWPPARIFLGDVGSVPLGFLIGWALLGLAVQGAWAAALILPAYYLGDATLTLLLRLRRGERVWRAHREHFYQRAVQGGLSHRRVSSLVSLLNLALIGLAAVAAVGPEGGYVGLAGAAVLTGLLLWYFARIAKGAGHGR
jgi:UDP-N-acetylmuramyl pentapeptide phosphotransferase/UDP-N-acetylglucosamine-1-phosphate transferase